MMGEAERVAAALPSYQIGGEIGRGAWGVVLAAEHRQLGRFVAIKRLPRNLSANPAVQRRFAGEARVLALLDHPHIVPIFDYVEQDDLCLLVMELLPEGTVRDRFVADGIRADTACSIGLATCSALHYAHSKGVLHRDIKPENLLFNSSGTLKVTDFGIAKVLWGSETQVTKAGELLGTPAYMAPEQVTGKALTPATDVYAVGTMLYELLSGQLPFSDEGGLITALYRHVHEQPEPLSESAPYLPAAISEVVMRALATDPAQRYPSAEDFGVALAEAANSCWGPGWLSASELEVMASKRVAQRISDPGGHGTGSGISLPGSSESARATVPKSLVRPSGPSPRPRVTAEPPQPVAEVAEEATPAAAPGGDEKSAPIAPEVDEEATLAAAPESDVAPPRPPPAPNGAATPESPGIPESPIRHPAAGPRVPAPVAVTGREAPARVRATRRRALITGVPFLALIAAAAAVVLVVTGSKGGTPPLPQITVPTTAPAANGPQVVFTDDFSNASSGWAADLTQGDAGTARYSGDGYHLVVLHPEPLLNTFSAASPYSPRVSSMTVTAVASFIQASGGDGAGVRCDQGGRNGLRYTFEIHADGTWVLFKIDDAGPKALQMGASPAILPNGSPNSVSGQCSEVAGGTFLAMSVNGAVLATVTDPHSGPIPWHAALIAFRGTASPGTEVRFNQFQTLATPSPS